MTLGISLWIILTYIIIKAKSENKANIVFLYILVFFAILETHVIAALIAVVTVAGLFLGNLLCNAANGKKLLINKYFYSVILFSVLMLFHWIYISRFINYIHDAINIEKLFNNYAHIIIIPGLNLKNIILYIDMIPQYLIYSLFVLGLLWVCNKQQMAEKRFVYSFSAGLLACVAIVTSLTNNVSLVPYRWSIYEYILIIPICIMGLIKFRKLNIWSMTFIFLISIIYIGLNVIGPVANNGTGLYYPNGYINTGGLNYAELDAANWSYYHLTDKMNSYGTTKDIAFGMIVDSKSPLSKMKGLIITDESYSFYLGRYLGVACMDITPITNDIVKQSDGNLILLRTYILNHDSYGYDMIINNQYIQGIMHPRPNLKKQIEGNELNEIYDSSYVWAYEA
jgi:hypothetical protein